MIRLDHEDRRRLPKILGAADAAEAVKILVCPDHHEGQLVLALGWSGEVCGGELRCPCDGCRDELFANGRELAELTSQLGGLEVVLVTFVDDARLAPRAPDVARFEGLRVECAADGVDLLDHLLFSGHRWRSVRSVSAGLDA